MTATAGRAALILFGLALHPCLGMSADQTSRPIDARDLATIRDLDGLSVSPDGNWAAFQMRQADPEANAYDQSWHVVSTRGGAPRRLADGGDPIQPAILGRFWGFGFIRTPPPVWSPDGRRILYLRRDQGRTEVWRSGLDGQDTEQLTHSDGDVRDFVFAAGGQSLLLQIEPRQEENDAALAQEGRTGFLYDRRFIPSHSRLPLALDQVSFEAATVYGRRIQVYDFNNRMQRRATEAEVAEFEKLSLAGNLLSVSTGGARAWAEAPDNNAERRVVVRRQGDDERKVCKAVECASEEFRGLWWRDESELIFGLSEYPDTLLYAWRPGERVPRLILRTPALLVANGATWDCAIGGTRLICFYEEADYPRRLVAVDLETGAIDTLYDPNANFQRINLGMSPQRLDIASDSGAGYLILPPDHAPGERHPLVIVTYRCSGFLRGGVGDEYPIFPFGAQGFAVLCHELPIQDRTRQRELGSYEAFAKWSRGPGDPIKHRIQKGLDAAVEYLSRSGVIDPDRIGLTGLSYGGETVMFALFKMERLSAGIASGTEFGPASSFLLGPAAKQDILQDFGLDSWSSDRWRTLSVTQNADRVRAPILLNVADHELMNALHPVTALEAVGRAVEMHVFPDEYHLKWQPAHRLAIYERNIDWMNFWLRGVEDSDPAKAAQYERWRIMRENQCRLFGPSGTERKADEDPPWYCRQ